MEKIKKNLNLIIYFLIMCVLTVIMFYNIDKKEGFHEDEMFSYGASNSSLSSTFISYRRIDNLDTIIKRDSIFETLKNLVYYKVLNKDEYAVKESKLMETTSTAVWRTKADAEEYLQIDTLKEALDFFTVYWNTAKDVHPPLFYFAVHLASILFFGHFSKYIIFYVNLLFFLGTCIILRKIFLKIDKKHLAIPNLILYGASIGAISTVMFQRMYMMLTFFTVWFLYTNLKIYYNDFELTKKLKIELAVVTILGFLTQYYFCIYAVFMAICMLVILIKRKEKNKAIHYFLQYVRAGIIGVILFLPSIYHIFFSYRGLGGTSSSFTYLEGLRDFCKQIYLAYSLSRKSGTCYIYNFANISYCRFS